MKVKGFPFKDSTIEVVIGISFMVTMILMYAWLVYVEIPKWEP
mgnify:CR=1 FL=1